MATDGRRSPDDSPPQSSTRKDRNKVTTAGGVEKATPYLYGTFEDEREFDAFYEYQLPPAHATETSFRHGEWLETRRRVYAALRAVGTSAAVLWRFSECGCDSMLEVRDDGRCHRVRSFHCKNRQCRPCSRDRAARLVGRLAELVEGRTCAHTVLTLADDGESLINRLNRLIRCWNTLRRRKWFKDRVAGGVFQIEITRGKLGRHWHVHAHIVHEGVALSETYLADLWRKITGDSFHVKSRDITEGEKIGGYIVKYATEGISEQVTQDHDALCEAIVALHGRRLLSTFGTWWGCDDQRQIEDGHEWRCVGSLPRITLAYLNGEQWAIGALTSVRKVPIRDGHEVRFVKLSALSNDPGERAAGPDG